MNNYEFVVLCQDGSPEEIQAAIKSGADPNARVNFGRPALMSACNHNTPEAVKILLDNGADPNAADSEGWTALMSVVDKDEAPIETVKYLLDAGANVNAKNEFDTTPLLRAVCWNNRVDIVNLLLDSGADMYAYGAIGFDYFEYGGETPAQASIGRMEVLKIFIERGVDVNRRYGGGSTLLIEAAGMWRSFEAVEYLLKAGADVNAKTENNLTALTAVAKHSPTEDTERTMKILLDCGADPNVGYEGLYALDYARKNQALAGTETLARLEEITNISKPAGKISPEEFETILEHGSLERIREAIEAGADLRKGSESYGDEPIFFTIRRRPEIELIKLLLDSGIDVNEPGGEETWNKDETLLMKSVTRPQNEYFRESPFELVKFLVERGADVNARGFGGSTVLMRAVSNRDAEVVKFLLDCGADVNAKSDDGQTALINAAYRGSLELCDLLLKAGADVNAKTANGRTALFELLNNLGYTSVMED
ncbi:MAG: ankyrin repeat domain-containing protein, partial [Synergistaceae bacterium]|nr:ankyrin repeat domain-containing protein [Synergistaceae bacterium]